jgi:putative transcriptional regulator
LKELRQLYQWSQADLARELGVSRQAVNGFESGKSDPSLDMAFKIATLLNVSIETRENAHVSSYFGSLLSRLSQDFV